MRIIISPAKQMRTDTDASAGLTMPVFLEKTEILTRWIRSLSYEEQKKLWACNDKIARQNNERFAHMDLRRNLTPALLAYDGIQYTYMAPAVFEDGQYDYVQEHLRILSGFYGVVKPMDGVVPYRLEMQAKAAVSGHKNLYDFWGDSEGSKIVQKGVYAKMARGEMVRYMAANGVTEPEQIRTFDWSGYQFREELSSEKQYVFTREEVPGKPGKQENL